MDLVASSQSAHRLQSYMPTEHVHLIVERYFSRIHRAALVLSGNPWDADDLAQETFLVLSRQFDQFRGGSSVYTWLYGILLNLDRNHRRRGTLRQHKLRVLWNQDFAGDHTSPAAESTVEVAEWKRSLWGHVAELPDSQRHTLVLRFSEQLRYEEIAEVLGCPLGTVKSRIFHALAALRKKLQFEEVADAATSSRRGGMHHAV
jgi:RNA polymerase sigma-70 factor, ECF subfamily